MELRYCERCGDIIKLPEDSPPAEDNFRFVCGRCEGERGDQAAPVTLPEARSEPSPGPAEDRHEGGPREETVKLGSSSEPPKGQAPAPPQVKAPRAPAAMPTTGPRESDSLASLLDGDRLTLFSADSVVRRKQEAEEKTRSHTRLRLVEDDGASDDSSPGSGEIQTGPSAKRIEFSCLYCMTALTIKPVKTKTRLRCPRCQQELTVDPWGRVSRKEGSSVVKIAPPGKTATMRQGSGVASPRAPQSSRSSTVPPLKTSSGSERQAPPAPVRAQGGSSAGARAPSGATRSSRTGFVFAKPTGSQGSSATKPAAGAGRRISPGSASVSRATPPRAERPSHGAAPGSQARSAPKRASSSRSVAWAGTPGSPPPREGDFLSSVGGDPTSELDAFFDQVVEDGQASPRGKQPAPNPKTADARTRGEEARRRSQRPARDAVGQPAQKAVTTDLRRTTTTTGRGLRAVLKALALTMVLTVPPVLSVAVVGRDSAGGRPGDTKAQVSSQRLGEIAAKGIDRLLRW